MAVKLQKLGNVIIIHIKPTTPFCQPLKTY